MAIKDPKFTALLQEIQIVLNESDVRIEDNFIALGGNSIMGMLIVETLRSRDGIEVNLTELLGSQIGQIGLKLAAK